MLQFLYVVCLFIYLFVCLVFFTVVFTTKESGLSPISSRILSKVGPFGCPGDAQKATKAQPRTPHLKSAAFIDRPDQVSSVVIWKNQGGN